jgi:hypothetical protein
MRAAKSGSHRRGRHDDRMSRAAFFCRSTDVLVFACLSCFSFLVCRLPTYGGPESSRLRKVAGLHRLFSFLGLPI